jgi:hypothetical protein
VRPSLSHGRRHWSAVSRDVSRLSYGRAVCNRRRACQVAKPKMAISIPDDTAELVWQAAESLYTLGSCLREGEVPFVPMADAARALHHVADRFPAPMQDKRTVMALRKHMRSEFRGRSQRSSARCRVPALLDGGLVDSLRARADSRGADSARKLPSASAARAASQIEGDERRSYLERASRWSHPCRETIHGPHRPGLL